jgi:hypothetical protein
LRIALQTVISISFDRLCRIGNSNRIAIEIFDDLLALLMGSSSPPKPQ